MTRTANGAVYEGQTKDADGQVFADVVLDGISSEVSGVLLTFPLAANELPTQDWHVWAIPDRFS